MSRRTRPTLLVALVALLGAIAPVLTPARAVAEPDPGCVRPVIRTAAPVGTGSCPGIRPGGFVVIPSERAGCTLGFVYRDPKAYRWYITTAGHCVVDEGKQATWAEGKGPVVTSGGKPFGRFVFASLRGPYDIGLILISKGIAPKASMCHFGGPTGISTANRGLTVLEHYGNSVFSNARLPARTGFAVGPQDGWVVRSLLPAFMGDSGGPVLDASNGRALGYVTSITVEIGLGAPIHVTRLGPQMALAQAAIKRSLVLRTAPHSPSPLRAL